MQSQKKILKDTVWITLAIGVMTTNISCGRETMKKDNNQTETLKTVLRSHLAGSWYTADAESLKKEIDGYLAAAKQEAHSDLIALILPHAGYRYSGSTAAFGINQIKGKHVKRVIIIGPTHQIPMRNQISIPDVTHYETPLGEIALDVDFIKALKQNSFAITRPEAHRGEHSVQIEIPLIQRALKNVKIVPIVCGQLDLKTANHIGVALGKLIDHDTRVVISSDFTHYGERFGYVPFKEDVPENIKKLDRGAYAFIEKKDAEGFVKYVDKTGATICGRNPIAILLSMLPENAVAHLLKYDTSGKLTGDFANSVSYLSAAFTGEWTAVQDEKKETENEQDSDAFLSESDKKSLLQLARSSLMYYLKHAKAGNAADLGIEITAGMSQTMGAFVTLHKDGRLRGCIGEIIPRRELYKAVIEHAVNSGFNDYRFSPVNQAEADKLDFEISALSPPREVASYKDIVIGKHGVVLQKGGRSAVFLPQVAPEQNWGIEETLTHLAVKAGLQPDDWRKNAAFMVFEAIVFSEE